MRKGLFRLLIAFLIVLAFGLYRLRKPHDSMTPIPPLVPFPFHGLLLIHDENEPAWYTVSFPNSHWTKIAKGTIWTAKDYTAVNSNGHWILRKVNDHKAIEIDVTTGRQQTLAWPLGSPDDINTFQFGKRLIQWDGREWCTIERTGKHRIPYSDKRLSGPPDVAPWMIVKPPYVIFIRQTSDNSEQTHDASYKFVATNTVSGDCRTLTELASNTWDFLQDENGRCIYALGSDGSLEQKAWEGTQFRTVHRYRLLGFPDDSVFRLIAVVNDRWIVYQTDTVDSQLWGLNLGQVRTKCFAFDMKTGNRSLLLIPPEQHVGSEVIAWINQ